nr:MAG TPA_asm: hypothetical protein [Caudoviricetes sp.]
MKKSDYDVIDIICAAVLTLFGIYLVFVLVVAVVSEIQAANGETPITTKTCCCCEVKNK